MKVSAARNMTSKVVSIGWGEKMGSAYSLMKQHGIRHLPVMDDRGKVVGVLSDRDIQRAMQSTISLDDAGTGIYSEKTEFEPHARVREYMSWPVKEVGAHESIRDVADRMIREKISSVLVMDGGALAGIITSEDILKAFVKILDQLSAPRTWSLNDLIQGRIDKLGSGRG